MWKHILDRLIICHTLNYQNTVTFFQVMGSPNGFAPLAIFCSYLTFISTFSSELKPHSHDILWRELICCSSVPLRCASLAVSFSLYYPIYLRCNLASDKFKFITQKLVMLQTNAKSLTRFWSVIILFQMGWLRSFG